MTLNLRVIIMFLGFLGDMEYNSMCSRNLNNIFSYFDNLC